MDVRVKTKQTRLISCGTLKQALLMEAVIHLPAAGIPENITRVDMELINHDSIEISVIPFPSELLISSESELLFENTFPA